MSNTTSHLIGEDAIIIRYDGLDAKDHEIDLGLLGDSLKGVDRIISVAANFAATQKFVQHRDAMSVRVMAGSPKAHCFELTAYLAWVSQNSLATSIVGGLTVTLISYIFSRLSRNKAEMKELRGALDTAIKELGSRDQSAVDRLLDTIDRMADALKPAARLAVSPIGKSASTLTISSSAKGAISRPVGIAEKEAIESVEPAEIGDEQVYTVVIHEMNIDSSSCRISLSDEPDGRIAAAITDPAATIPNNRYVRAFAAMEPLAVKAKVAIRDGLIEKLYISDTIVSAPS